VAISALCIWTGETIQNRGFGVLEIGQAQNGSCSGGLVLERDFLFMTGASMPPVNN